MLQLTVPGGIPPAFVPTGHQILFPPGTSLSYDGVTWALYVNKLQNRSWMAYALPTGTKIVPMGGVRRVTFDFAGMDRYVKQRQGAGCSACEDD